MSRITAKICGLSTPETLDAAIAGGASHVGFVFFPKSPRHVTFEQAGALAARVPSRIGRVGVFVDPDDATLETAAKAGFLTAIQIHNAPPSRFWAVESRMRRAAIDLWAAVSVRRASDLDAARSYGPPEVSKIVYDAKTPDDSLLPGGMGLRFDWTMLRNYRHSNDWALAGGLDAQNVAEAIHITGAQMVDVSSGVESAPGIKDVDKIAAFLKATAQL